MKRVGKGLPGTLRRISSIPRRYGVRAAKMQQRLRGMIDLLQSLEITPTIPITARTLERHPEFGSELRAVDSAVHGYHHVAYAEMTPTEQQRDLDSARQVFVRHGFPVRGFRAPYLSANGTTRELLSKAGFLYDSSEPRVMSAPDDPLMLRAQHLAALRYTDQDGSAHVTCRDGLVEIPVSLPDDEILVDGLGITSSETITRVFDRMFDVACTERSALVLQIHPERFPLFVDAVRHISRRAADSGAWKASLSEIADRTARAGESRKASFTLAVTGDLDAATLWDFASRLWERG